MCSCLFRIYDHLALIFFTLRHVCPPIASALTYTRPGLSCLCSAGEKSSMGASGSDESKYGIQNSCQTVLKMPPVAGSADRLPDSSALRRFKGESRSAGEYSPYRQIVRSSYASNAVVCFLA